MKQLQTYGDERELAFCAFCGGETGTRDHCPSRVFLDKPYPENLPVVPACTACNASFSSDEEYLACLICCVRAGGSDPDAIDRAKIRRILVSKPALRARLDNARSEHDGHISFAPEGERVRNVVVKLAKGHSLFELHMPSQEAPNIVEIFPLPALSEVQRRHFENPPEPIMLPEVGSRELQRLVAQGTGNGVGWLEVQEGRYRYHTAVYEGAAVRIVIDEYLGALIEWTS